MQYIKQVSLILLVTLTGEVLKCVIPLRIPASIYGFIIFYILLSLRIIKLDDVKKVGMFLIDIMPLMFIPISAGLINSWDELSSIFLYVILAVVPITILIIGITGKITEKLVKEKEYD